MIHRGIARRRSDDRRVDRCATRIEWEPTTMLVHGAQSAGGVDERHRMPLGELHNERARKATAHFDAFDLRMRAHTLFERSERIPDTARRVDMQPVEDLGGRGVPRSEDLYFSHAEEGEL